jgi:PTS system nitrogen regulatory IIA component
MMAPSPMHSPVRLTELFPHEAIHVGMEPHTKSETIAELVHHAVAAGQLPSQAERPIIEAILERETLGSTALGHGVAFPHCRWRSLDRFVGVLGLVQGGIPFDAMDGEPVDSIFLTLSPPDAPVQSFDVLGRLVAIGRNPSLHRILCGCRTAEEVAAFLAELDQPVVGRLDELARMSLSRRGREPRDPWRELAIFSLTREDRPGGDSSGPRWL